jgi:hypothetical protein
VGQSVELLRERDPESAVMTGEDIFFYFNIVSGGSGGILASAHIQTERFLKVYDSVRRNDIGHALADWNQWEAGNYASPPTTVGWWLWESRLSPVWSARHYLGRQEAVMARTHPDVATGVVHEVPMDLRRALTSDLVALTKWNDLTPLARNEWICWTTSVKKPETRANHVERTRSELKEGKRRPCCWPGCPHR